MFTEDNNNILLYTAKIESGDIIACDKIHKVYRRLADKVLDTDAEYFYSQQRGEHIIRFFEKYLKHSKGKMGGKPIILELWEKAMFEAQYGFINIDGLRQYQRKVLIVGKKNGKSLLSSGEGNYLLTADGESGPEIYAVATKQEQAKIIWSESKRMRNKSPVLSKRVKATINELRCESNDGVFKALASDSNTMDGLNVHGALLDEIQQWRNGRPLYDIIVDGISAREQPMISITSTAGTVREDIYDEIYEECENIIAGYDQVDGYKDERTLPLIYELDKIEEMYDEKMWIKANPNLGVSKSVDYLRDKVNRAKNNPVIAKNVLCKEFNIRQTSNESWLRFEQLNNEQKFDINELKPRYCIGGLDLSNTTDLTCATVIFKIPNDDNLYVEQMYWLPEELLEERVKYDKTPYDKWHLNGYLRLSEGNKINYKDVVKWFVEIQEKYDLYMYKIGFDSWNSQYIVDELKDNFGEHSLEKIVQGPKTFSSPMKVFAADLSAKKIIYNNNPMLKWCLANSAIEVDRNDNIALIKTSKSTRRIDGVASLLDAYICLINNQDDYLNLI